MRVEILHVPDCPNVALLEVRLRQAHADQRAELDVTHHVVEDLEAAVALGMTGSPTLLVDGVDPFACPGLTPSLSCRLYPDETGHLAGAPPVDDLRRALAGYRRAILGELRDDCACSVEGGAVLRDVRRRAVPVDRVERAVLRAILDAFATTGQPSGRVELDRVAQRLRSAAGPVLERLHEADTIRLGSDGEVRVAYPFSAMPTHHLVQLATGTQAHAMCAIDALGMPAMLGVDAVITTTDPVSDAPITVTVADGESTWDPATAVVFVGARAGSGPSADTCCDYLNIFTNRESAHAWTRAHPDVAGEIVDRAEAERLGREIFGGLLA
jgi:hypothetical protein